MPRRFRGPVERTRDGYRVRVGEHEQAVVLNLMEQLRDLLLTAPADDPRLRRLFPTAYHAHPELDAEYQRLMRDELVASRVSAIEGVGQALSGQLLSEDELYRFMQSLNAVRLVLGTIVDIGEDDDPELLAEDDPMAPERHLYHYLSWLLDWTVRAMSGR